MEEVFIPSQELITVKESQPQFHHNKKTTQWSYTQDQSKRDPEKSAGTEESGLEVKRSSGTAHPGHESPALMVPCLPSSIIIMGFYFYLTVKCRRIQLQASHCFTD